MTPESDLAEAAIRLALLIEADSIPFLQRYRDASLGNAARQIRRICAARFRKQRKAVLAALKAIPQLKAREAETDQRQIIIDAVTAQLATPVYSVPVSAGSAATFDGSISTAIEAGARGVSHIMTAAAPESAESFIAEYLKDGGFTRLSGQLDKTTVDRLASTIADVYEQGGDFDAITAAVRSEFADFTSARVTMIAQTELNDAYNQSIFHFGQEAGATMKSWETEPGACIICLANELEGSIPMDQDFGSGDDMPTAHPLCNCSLMVHA